MIRYLKRRIVAKTGSGYSPHPNKGDFSGTVFTTRGGTQNFTFTLPTPTPALAETMYDFLNVVDFNMNVTAGANKITTFNNATATTVSVNTSGQKIGARISAVCDGVTWFCTGETAGVTYVVT